MAKLLLAAFRSVEDDPSLELVTKVLEPVPHSHWREEDIRRPERRARVAADEHAATRDDDVQFVLLAWLARVGGGRRGALDRHRSAREERHREMAIGKFARPRVRGPRAYRQRSRLRLVAHIPIVTRFSRRREPFTR